MAGPQILTWCSRHCCNLLLERERERERETSCKVEVSHLQFNRHFSINVSLYFLESFSPLLKLQLYMIMGYVREREYSF